MTYRHHIIPLHEWRQRINPKATRRNKAYNAPNNIVWLTLEQHIQVHQLLYELNGSEFDRLAVQVMIGRIGKEEAHLLAARIANTGNKYSLGLKRTEEQKRHHSIFMAGNRHSEGHKHTDAAKQKVSEARKKLSYIWSVEQRQLAAVRARTYKNNLGRKWSEEYKKKMSLRLKGHLQQKLTCPHCLRIGGNTMRTYHFNNCKMKAGIC